MVVNCIIHVLSTSLTIMHSFWFHHDSFPIKSFEILMKWSNARCLVGIWMSNPWRACQRGLARSIVGFNSASCLHLMRTKGLDYLRTSFYRVSDITLPSLLLATGCFRNGISWTWNACLALKSSSKTFLHGRRTDIGCWKMWARESSFGL